MGATPAGRLAAAAATVSVLILAGIAHGGDDLPPLPPALAPEAPKPAPRFFPAPDPLPAPAPAPAPIEATAPAKGSETAPDLDPVAVRAEASERLKAPTHPGDKDKDSSAHEKALRDLLRERLDLLKSWDEVAKARHDAEQPEPSPERQEADGKADLERTKAALDHAARDPDSLLIGPFRDRPATIDDAFCAAMKETIESASTDLKTWKEKLEAVRATAARKGGAALSALRVERDKIHQRLAALAPLEAERAAAVAAAKTPEEAELARARQVNFTWERRVEGERLQAQEALLTLEAKRANLAELELQVGDAHVALASKTLDRLQECHRSITARQERALKTAADTEQKRADRADDPLESYRLRRSAELLELKARVLKEENALASPGYPSLEEQKSLADRADADFASVKHLLDDGKVSHLDALRLNNDFRRIGPERARIVARERAAATRVLTYYENALSTVELDLINDARDDRTEYDRLAESLPAERHAEAAVLFEKNERQHIALLNRRRLALEKLGARAEQALEQVERRLRTLDDQYGFIRTHIFWVRDEAPIGPGELEQARHDGARAVRALFRMAREAGDPARWGRVSAEFVAALIGLVVLPWPLRRLGNALRAWRPAAGPALVSLRTVRGLAIGLSASTLGPAYLGLVAYAARQGPWPREVGWASAAFLAWWAAVGAVVNLARWMLRRDGWAEAVLLMPKDVARQWRRAALIIGAAVLGFLLPAGLLDEGVIATGGRPVSAPALGRCLVLGFELTLWAVAFRLVRKHAPLVAWIAQSPDRLGWLKRRRRAIGGALLLAIGGVIALDAVGFSFTARRLAIGAGQSVLLVAGCGVLYRLLRAAIDRHGWRWARSGRALLASESADGASPPDELASRLRRLAGYLVPGLGLLAAAWLWGVDWALFRFLGAQVLWYADAAKTPVTVGHFASFLAILAVTVAAWRHMSTFFAVAVFPRMRDDPGVQFATVTLCRYAVLAVGLLTGLSAIHLGLEKIGVVLAALGVGLGFGLQEIVSNFVCGIILLLERPIRVGDVVTVSGMIGKVDRIHIRATTITNGDNQSIIVPNRAFITGDLINWTLKDKVIRVSIRMKVAHGNDPDRVAEQLLQIAREDPDVLRNPLPASFMEDFSDSALTFVLHVHVPEPSLGARVRHRLFTQVQRRFQELGIEIPLPTQELVVKPVGAHPAMTVVPMVPGARLDPASPTPPVPRFTAPPPIPAPVEDCHRGVDE